MSTLTRLRWFINNCISFSLLNIFTVFFRKNKSTEKSILLFNANVLGDTVISSLILENDYMFSKYEHVYFLFPEEYHPLFEHYIGRVILLKFNKKRYKWSIVYRIKLLIRLKSLRVKEAVNLTSSRGISSDEIMLLCGAHNISCFENTWEKTPKAFSAIIDRKYDQILCSGIINEYERIYELIKSLSSKNNVTGRKPIFKLEKYNSNEIMEKYGSTQGYVVIAPFAGTHNQTWGIDNFTKLAKELSNEYLVVLIGNDTERKIINRIMSHTKNILNLAGNISLSEMSSVIHNSRLFIGNDSGLAHIALRTEVQMIIILGGGSFNKYLPYKESERRKYFYNKLDCYGCEWYCTQREKFCFTKINYSEILQTAKTLLNR